MPQQRFREFMQLKLDEAIGAESDSKRRALLREFFFAALSEVVDEVLDREIAPIDGNPAPPKFEIRQDSDYYMYNLARANAFVSFTDDQRKVLRGLVMHTAFDVLDGVLYVLDFMPGCELEIRLHSRQNPSFNVLLRSPETDQLQYGRNRIPKPLTKYEY